MEQMYHRRHECWPDLYTSFAEYELATGSMQGYREKTEDRNVMFIGFQVT